MHFFHTNQVAKVFTKNSKNGKQISFPLEWSVEKKICAQLVKLEDSMFNPPRFFWWDENILKKNLKKPRDPSL